MSSSSAPVAPIVGDVQRRATERLRLLADTGALLATTLDLDAALASLARLTVQWFADACLVQLFSGTHVSATAVAASDPALEAALHRATQACCRADASLTISLTRVLATNREQLVREVDEHGLRDLAVDDEQFEVLRPLGLRSVIRAPLVARGRVLGVVTLARTHGDLYDEDDLALAAELGRRAALAFDNARLYKRAHDAIALRDEFLALASHELNTPLTPLKMQLDVLRRGGLSHERANEKLDAAAREVTRLSRIVADLLEVARIGEGSFSLAPERFDLAVLVDDVVVRTAEQAQRAASPVRVHAERPCFGTWDRTRIDQVVSNLLSNAIKFGNRHPVDLELTCDERTARLVVRDRGIGIAAEQHERIFQRFARAASSRHYGGFGLGLWMVQRIVELSGGTVSVESEPQHGSSFTVELPREPPGTRE
jgi:signal transduction histidine kinase